MPEITAPFALNEFGAAWCNGANRLHQLHQTQLRQMVQRVTNDISMLWSHCITGWCRWCRFCRALPGETLLGVSRVVQRLVQIKRKAESALVLNT